MTFLNTLNLSGNRLSDFKLTLQVAHAQLTLRVTVIVAHAQRPNQRVPLVAPSPAGLCPGLW